MNTRNTNTTVTTSFGHVAQPGAPRITDAITAWIIGGSADKLTTTGAGPTHTRRQIAQGCVSRAILRIFALNVFSASQGIDDRNDLTPAYAGAKLLIAADLVAALLADGSPATLLAVARGAELLVPDLRENEPEGPLTIDLPAEIAAAHGIHALVHGADQSDFSDVAEWFGRHRVAPAIAVHGQGPDSEVAIVYEALFGGLQGREFELPEIGLTDRSRNACLLAEGFAASFRDGWLATAHRATVQ